MYEVYNCLLKALTETGFTSHLDPSITGHFLKLRGFFAACSVTCHQEMLKGSQAEEYLVYLGKKRGTHDKMLGCEDLEQVGS